MITNYSEAQKKELVCTYTKRIQELSLDSSLSKQIIDRCIVTMISFLSGECDIEEVNAERKKNVERMHSIDSDKSFNDRLIRGCHWAIVEMFSECCSVELFQKGWINSPGSGVVNIDRVCKEIQWIKALYYSGPERDSTDREIRKIARKKGQEATIKELEYQLQLAKAITEER